ncbi:MAG: Aldo/keto reductase [Candidatus Hydrogenedentes bacterium]|nr:Aldo/keto reductase [Candidatus Hydrogenedentota bacterium]
MRKEDDMTDLDRRGFLKSTAGMLLAATLMPGRSGAAAALPKAADVRTLGKTGLQCSYLGIGTGFRGSGIGITQQILKMTGDEFVGMLEHAYQRGVTYFDLADRYGSHHYMCEAMKRSIPREKIMLLSKVWSREPEEARSDIERIRKELDTDCIDILLMHCLRKGEENWPETLKPLMDVFSEAKAKGWIRAHGVSCHSLQALERVPETEWADAVLVRINPFSSHMDGPTEAVVPIVAKIHEAGKAVLGMKILGEGDPNVVAKIDESLQFAAQLGSIDAITIGFMGNAEIDDAITRIDALT